jgi:NADPH2:quinone reductase
MKAYAVEAEGSQPSHVELDAPDPEPGEVRVRVAAASVNGFDLAVAAGWMGAFFEHRYPVVLGREFTGVIDDLGDEVDGYAVGDRVLGVVSKPHLKEGAFAEYTTAIAANSIVLAPESLSDAEAASLAHTGSTALLCLAALGDEPAGKQLLIVGATGGVGTLLVQLASAAGVEVIATGRTEEGRAMLTDLGAAQTVDYADLDAAVRAIAPDGVDAAVHLSGDPVAIAALVKDGGTFVSPLLYAPEMLPGSERLEFVAIAGYPTGDGLRYLADLAESGDLRIIVDRELPFDEVAAGFEAFGHETLGNIVVLID